MTRHAPPTRLRSTVAVLVVVTSTLAVPVAAGAAPPSPPPAFVPHANNVKVPWSSTAARFVPGRVVVVWRHDADLRDRRALVSPIDPRRAAAAARLGVGVVRVSGSIASALHRLRRSPLVRFAEADRVAIPATLTPPDDALFVDQWALHNTGQQHPLTIYDDNGSRTRRGTPGSDVNAMRAWAAESVHDPVVVAVVDTGVDIGHPDLANRLWQDPDYPNGGFDFADHDDDPSPIGANDENSHGTHVAGIIAAEQDNAEGVSGVCPDCRIMALRIGSASTLTLGAELKAIAFAIEHEADVINLSFGSPVWSESERAAIRAAGRAGILVVAAAGNASADNDVPFYLNSSVAAPLYPASYTLPNILSVAASNDRDEYGYASQCRSMKLPLYRCGFTSWGHDSVDVAAPGVDVISTVRRGRGPALFDGNYDVWDGTSMAAPMVAGIAASVRSEHPGYSAIDVKNAVMNGVDHPRALVLYDAWASITGVPKRALSGDFTVTQGRVNAFAALSAATTNATPRSDGNIDGARRIGGRAATGRVSWPADANDVYRKRLVRGARYRVVLDGPNGSDLDLWVWTPGTKEIAQFTSGCFVGRACPALAGESGRDGADENVTFTARTAGAYYVQVNGWYSGGRYRLRLERV